MNRLLNGRKLRLLIEPCYMTKADRLREKVCNILAPENESLCKKVAEMSQSVRLALRLDWEPAPVLAAWGWGEGVGHNVFQNYWEGLAPVTQPPFLRQCFIGR